jgi:methylenetetrahydrofolate dehydrogenase (NADP+)/methenyltetrahydrofolate cyclohydrolase
MVGNNPASRAYVNGKLKDCEECGINFLLSCLSEDVTQQEIIDKINTLNQDSSIHGILVQLPLPAWFDKAEIISAIAPEKDVDCFCAENIGKMVANYSGFLPCTPLGIMNMLDVYDIDVTGKHCVVIGRSDIVGKPMASLLINRGATVTVCHSQTANLQSHTQMADIIICAVGKEKFLTADMVKDGVIVIDVGINRNADGKLCGDVDFEAVAEKASAITPVPGGVGLMTRAALLINILRAYNESNQV